VRQTTLTGLESALFRDKTDGMREKIGPAGPLGLSGETDRVYPGNVAAVHIHDALNERVIVVEKANSATTVVWNPWAELAVKLADLTDDAWPGFVCVEAANTATDAITLQQGESHTMQVVVNVGA
jgi:glucose-6-phosphate 1-epimerase